MQRKRMLLFPYVCIGVLLLAACGRQPGNSSSSSGDTPSVTSTSAIQPGNSTSNKVTVTVGKAHYTSNDTITVTVNNGLAKSIAAANHQSGCTIVTLQWQDTQGNWQNQNRCRQGVMTRMITLPPRSSLVQAISPTSGTFAINAQWAKGNYRMVFNFTLSNTDVESIPATGVSGSPIYSPTFVVA